MRLSDVQWFFQRGYRPDNAHLIIAGDFEETRARQLINAYFGPIGNPPTPPAERRLAPQTAFHAGSMQLEVHGLLRERLAFAWPSPPPGTRQRAVLALFSRVFAGRLAHRLLKQSDLAANVQLTFWDLDGGSALLFSVDLSPNTLGYEVEAAVADEWVRTWSSDWNAMLERTKQSEIVAMLEDFETPLEQAVDQLVSARFEHRTLDWTRHLAELRSVTVADVLGMQAFFRDRPLLVGRMLRETPGDPVPASGRLSIE